MTSRVKKQLAVIVVSLAGTALLAYLYADRLPEPMNSLSQQPVDPSQLIQETQQTAVEGIVLANNGVDQLQIRLELRDGQRDILVPVTSDTPLVKRTFANGQVNDQKTSLSEVSIGDEVSIVVVTGALNLADQTSITPIEVIFRGE